MGTSRAALAPFILCLIAACTTARGQQSVLGANVAKYVTATMDGSYDWYERGFNPDAPTTGLPPAGLTAATTGSAGTRGPSGTFLLQPYTGNNVLLLNAGAESGTLTLSTPTAANALWITTATGIGPAHLNTVTHFSDGTPDFTQNFFTQPDWFTSTPNVFNASGRIQIYPTDIDGVESDAGTFSAVNTTVPTIAITTIVFPNPAVHPVSSIDLSWILSQTSPYYSSNTAVFGVSLSINGAAGPFNAAQLTASSFNQDVVVEASALGSASALPEPGILLSGLTASVLLLRRRRPLKNRCRALSESLEPRCLLSATWTVTSTADDGSAGTLRSVISASAAGDTIVFDSTTFSADVGAPHVITLNGTPIEISHDLTIDGPGSEVATISGNDVTRGLIIDAGTDATVSGLSIEHCANTVNTTGGAIYVNQGGELSVSASVFSDNQGNEGGAIFSQGVCNVTASSFLGNTASNTVDSTAGGGAIDNSFGTLEVSDSDFSSNSAIEGGAIDNYGTFRSVGSATITNCTFENNTASGRNYGGGALGSGGNLQMSGCAFTGNSETHFAGFGGAVSIYNGTTTIASCQFLQNSARSGGALYNGSIATISNTTFDSNFNLGTFQSGGGAVSNGGTLNLMGCSVYANVAADSAGAVLNGGSAKIINTTIANNSGGGIYNTGSLLLANTTVSGNVGGVVGGIDAIAPVTLNNSIVAGNSLPVQPFEQVAQASDIVGTATGSFDLIGVGGSGGLINSVNYDMVGVPDPGLSPLGNFGGPTQTMALLPGSLAFNTGYIPLAVDQNGQALTTDQRGSPRVGSSSVDVGAYEASMPSSAPSNLIAVPGSDNITLTWTSAGTGSPFSVYRGTSPDGEGAVAIAANVTSNSYVDPTTVDGVTYYYQVASANALGTSPRTNEASSAALPMAPLASPDGQSGITLVRDADYHDIDWTAGSASGQFSAADPNPVTIAGNPALTTITVDYSRGGALPEFLRLNGTFLFQSTSYLLFYDVNNVIDINRSTVYFRFIPSGGDPVANVTSDLKNGYDSGAWNGPAPLAATSIVSSAVASGPPGTYSVGFADAADDVVAGQPVNTIEVRFTLAGDANLDGVVDLKDAGRLQANWNATGSPAWDQGNFNYDGTVDPNDALVMVRNWNAAVAGAVAPDAVGSAADAAGPAAGGLGTSGSAATATATVSLGGESAGSGASTADLSSEPSSEVSPAVISPPVSAAVQMPPAIGLLPAADPAVGVLPAAKPAVSVLPAIASNSAAPALIVASSVGLTAVVPPPTARAHRADPESCPVVTTVLMKARIVIPALVVRPDAVESTRARTAAAIEGATPAVPSSGPAVDPSSPGSENHRAKRSGRSVARGS